MITLGDVLVEFKARKSLDQDPPVLTLTEKNGFIRQDQRFKKRLATEDTTKYKLIQSNDFAFNPYLLWAGALARNTISDTGVISPLYPTFKVQSGYDPSYIEKLLLSPQMIRRYDTIAFGSAPRRRRSSVKDFLQIPLEEIPPLDEQRRIASILDEIHANSYKLRVRKSSLLLLPGKLFNKILPMDAEYVRLEDFCDIQGGLQISSKRDTLPLSVDYVRVANVHRGFLDLNEIKSIQCSEKEIERTALKEDDLLFVEGHANACEVGRVARWVGSDSTMVHQNHLIRARPNPFTFDPIFLEQWFCTPAGSEHFKRNARTTSGLNTINTSVVKSAKVPNVDPRVQQEFRKVKQEIDTVISIQEIQIQKNKELEQALQSRAFRGEL